MLAGSYCTFCGPTIDPFTKRHKLVHDGGFPKFADYIVAKILYNRSRFSDTLVTRYSLPNHKISGEQESWNNFWKYPPLCTSLLVAMHDNIENTSIEVGLSSYDKEINLLETKKSTEFSC